MSSCVIYKLMIDDIQVEYKKYLLLTSGYVREFEMHFKLHYAFPEYLVLLTTAFGYMLIATLDYFEKFINVDIYHEYDDDLDELELQLDTRNCSVISNMNFMVSRLMNSLAGDFNNNFVNQGIGSKLFLKCLLHVRESKVIKSGIEIMLITEIAHNNTPQSFKSLWNRLKPQDILYTLLVKWKRKTSIVMKIFSLFAEMTSNNDDIETKCDFIQTYIFRIIENYLHRLNRKRIKSFRDIHVQIMLQIAILFRNLIDITNSYSILSVSEYHDHLIWFITYIISFLFKKTYYIYVYGLDLFDESVPSHTEWIDTLINIFIIMIECLHKFCDQNEFIIHQIKSIWTDVPGLIYILVKLLKHKNNKLSLETYIPNIVMIMLNNNDVNWCNSFIPNAIKFGIIESLINTTQISITENILCCLSIMYKLISFTHATIGEYLLNDKALKYLDYIYRYSYISNAACLHQKALQNVQSILMENENNLDLMWRIIRHNNGELIDIISDCLLHFDCDVVDQGLVVEYYSPTKYSDIDIQLYVLSMVINFMQRSDKISQHDFIYQKLQEQAIGELIHNNLGFVKMNGIVDVDYIRKMKMTKYIPMIDVLVKYPKLFPDIEI